MWHDPSMSAPPSTIPPGWSPADLATLAELAETFVRGGSVRRANLAAEALSTSADPAQVRQLRLVLRLLESRVANLLVTGRPVAFRDRTPAERERVLLGWATSRVPLRRSAFQAFRKLLTFLAYADPGPPGAINPLHAAIGYAPERPPVTPNVTPIRPLDVHASAGTDTPDQPTTLDADIVVVGSGAGGGVIAAELTRAGRSVIVVEAGPFLDEAHLPTDEMDAYDRVYLNHGLLTTWDGAITMLAGAAVGGGTLVNWMTCIAAPDDVRADWARDHGLDGIDGASFDDDVATVERELGVATSVLIPPKDDVILRGAAALGWEVAPIRRNAADCGDCGSCPFGCPRGAKQSTMRVHLAAAAAGGARIVERARVTKILVEGGHAAGVEAEVHLMDPAAGTPVVGPGRAGMAGPRTRRLVVRAPQVVVAAGALRTPAVLLGSGLDHPAIGRHLRLHPVPVIAAIFDEPIDMWLGTMQAARSLQFGAPDGDRNGYVIESAPGHPGLIALALPWEGTDAHAELLGRIRHVAPLIAITRDGGEGRVRLTASGRARIDYRLDERGVATLRHALVSMAGIARAAGARRMLAAGTPPAWHGRTGFAPGQEARSYAVFEDALRRLDFAPNRGSVFSAHQMGSARMGATADHPCDPVGRVRSREGSIIAGLYVGDGSLFPTGIGVNPMITIMALARRVARTIVAEGRAAG
jgi:choline dehydrogenase-like flavoprotein